MSLKRSAKHTKEVAVPAAKKIRFDEDDIDSEDDEPMQLPSKLGQRGGQANPSRHVQGFSKHRHHRQDEEDEEDDELTNGSDEQDGDDDGDDGEGVSGSEDEDGDDSEDAGFEEGEEDDGLQGGPNPKPRGRQGSDEGGSDSEEGSGDSDEEGSGSEGGSESEQESDLEDILEKQVAELPFEVLERLKQDGRGPVGMAARAAARAAKEQQASFKRLNRHRPSETSSKRPVPRFREVLPVPKKQGLDPRFDRPGAGGSRGPSSQHPAAEEAMRRRYAFLYDEVLPQERRELRDKMQKERNPRFKAKLQSQLTRLDQAQKREEERRRKSEMQGQAKSQERAAVAAGKKPFFLKKSEQRRLELLARYQQLQQSGQLDKFMEKRRRKNAAKDHRYVPSARRGGDE